MHLQHFGQLHLQYFGQLSEDLVVVLEACPMWREWGSTAFPVGSSRYAQLMYWMTAPHQVVHLPCWLRGTSSILITCATASSSLSLHLAQNRGTSPHPGLLFLPGILPDSTDNLVMFQTDWSNSVWVFYLQPELEACSLQSACLKEEDLVLHKNIHIPLHINRISIHPCTKSHRKKRPICAP